jgi:Flp pilus assembly protein TadD
LTALERANPKDRELQLQMGVLELHDKHFKEAEEYFRKLSANGNNDVRPLSGLTQTLASEGQLDKAVALLQEETKKTPNNNQVRYLYAVTAAMAGRYDTALAEFQHLAAVSPQPQLYLALGNVFRIKKDYSNALANLEKSAQLAPKDSRPVVAEAEVLDASGRTREALDKYRVALRLAPNNATLLNNVAYLLADTGGSLDEALKYARRAVELDSKQPRYNDTLGWVYYKQNLNDTALQVFRGLTETNPDNPTFHYHFAMAAAGWPAQLQAFSTLSLSSAGAESGMPPWCTPLLMLAGGSCDWRENFNYALRRPRITTSAPDTNAKR